MSRGECSLQACDRLGISYPPGERREEADRQACLIRAEVPTEPVRLAAAVVELEAPEHIAEIAGASTTLSTACMSALSGAGSLTPSSACLMATLLPMSTAPTIWTC